MVNLELVKQRNVSDENVEHINAIHDTLELLIDTYSLECDYDTTFDLITQAEFALQALWGFTQDDRYHTWVKRLNSRHFQLTWVGRTFQCVDTGAQTTIEPFVFERQLIHISGVASIDLGVCNGYHRKIGNIVEVFDKSKSILSVEPRVLYTSEPVPSLADA